MTNTREPRQIFLIHLRAEEGIDALRALRAALKMLGRRFGLRAVEVREEADE